MGVAGELGQGDDGSQGDPTAAGSGTQRCPAMEGGRRSCVGHRSHSRVSCTPRHFQSGPRRPGAGRAQGATAHRDQRDMKEILVDANVLISFLTDRNENQQKKAATLFRGATDRKHILAIHSIAIMEMVYVLVHLYKADPLEVSRSVSNLLAIPGVVTAAEVPWSLVLESWPLVISSFGDAILVAVAREGRHERGRARVGPHPYGFGQAGSASSRTSTVEKPWCLITITCWANSSRSSGMWVMTPTMRPPTLRLCKVSDASARVSGSSVPNPSSMNRLSRFTAPTARCTWSLSSRARASEVRNVSPPLSVSLIRVSSALS